MYYLSKKLYFKNKKHIFMLQFFIILLIVFLFVFSNPIFAGLFDSNPNINF